MNLTSLHRWYHLKWERPWTVLPGQGKTGKEIFKECKPERPRAVKATFLKKSTQKETRLKWERHEPEKGRRGKTMIIELYVYMLVCSQILIVWKYVCPFLRPWPLLITESKHVAWVPVTWHLVGGVWLGVELGPGLASGLPQGRSGGPTTRWAHDAVGPPLWWAHTSHSHFPPRDDGAFL